MKIVVAWRLALASPLFDASSPQFVDLLATCPIVSGAIVSKPLLNLPEGRVVLFAMDVGQQISDHRVPFVATVLHASDDVLRDRMLNREGDGFRDLTVSMRLNLEVARDLMPFENLIDTSALSPTEVAQAILAAMRRSGTRHAD